MAVTVKPRSKEYLKCSLDYYRGEIQTLKNQITFLESLIREEKKSLVNSGKPHDRLWTLRLLLKNSRDNLKSYRQEMVRVDKEYNRRFNPSQQSITKRTLIYDREYWRNLGKITDSEVLECCKSREKAGEIYTTIIEISSLLSYIGIPRKMIKCIEAWEPNTIVKVYSEEYDDSSGYYVSRRAILVEVLS